MVAGPVTMHTLPADICLGSPQTRLDQSYPSRAGFSFHEGALHSLLSEQVTSTFQRWVAILRNGHVISKAITNTSFTP